MTIRCDRIQVYCDHPECDYSNYYRNHAEFIQFGGEGAECDDCKQREERAKWRSEEEERGWFLCKVCGEVTTKNKDKICCKCGHDE